MKLWNNYIAMPYKINNPEGKVLQNGDLVIVHQPDGVDGSKNFYYAYVFTEEYGLYASFRSLESTNGEDTAQVDEFWFNRLEPVSWWSEENRTIQSPKFKALAAMVGIHPNQCMGMPGHDGTLIVTLKEHNY